MIKSIANGYHIHDTLTSGLRITINPSTYKRIEDAFGHLEKQNIKAMTKYAFKVSRDKFGSNNPDYGAVEFASWLISLYTLPSGSEREGIKFTTIGIKISKEKLRNGSFVDYINLKANPTAIMRNGYALDAAAVDPKRLLTAPFDTLDEITDLYFKSKKLNGGIFDKDEQELIDSGNLGLRDIEIAFPLKITSDAYTRADSQKTPEMRLKAYEDIKNDIILNFTRIYGVRMSFRDRVMDIGDLLNLDFTRYPEDSTISKSTGFRITVKHRSNNKVNLCSFTMYDKMAEMEDKGKKWVLEDATNKKIWEKYLRVDIRIYPEFMRQLYAQIFGKDIAKKIDVFTINHWIEIEDEMGKYLSSWLLRRILNRIEFPFLSSTKKEIQDFCAEIQAKYGTETMEAWQSCVKYNAADLFHEDAKSKEKSWSKFLSSLNAPSKLGGLLFSMQSVFNFTNVLNIQDLSGVFEIEDLARKIRSKNDQDFYEKEKFAFKEPILDFAYSDDSVDIRP